MHTLERAIELIRLWEPAFAGKGYHLALAGSCLYRGTSEKDIDILVYPHDRSKQLCDDELISFLSDLGLEFKRHTTLKYVNRPVLIFETIDGDRIDFLLVDKLPI